MEKCENKPKALQGISCPSSFLMHTIALKWPVSFGLAGAFVLKRKIQEGSSESNSDTVRTGQQPL